MPTTGNPTTCAATLAALLQEALALADPAAIARTACELADIEKRTDFESFGRASRHVAGLFRAAGAETEELWFPADGTTRHGCWTAPIGFRTTRAVFALTDPPQCAGIVADRDAEPNTAFVGTGYTGPAGVAGELVPYVDGLAAGAEDLRGKLVLLTTTEPMSVRRQLVRGGAAGVISSFHGGKGDLSPDYVKWVNAWDAAPDGWLPGAAAAAENLPAICISRAQGERLIQQLAQGPVRGRIITEGAFFAGELPAVNAHTPGEEDRDVLLTGHMYEQGLQDNACGVALSVQAARIVAGLKRAQNVSVLKRGIRHFHGQECYGVLGLHQYHPDMTARAFAHATLDMLGRAGPIIVKRGLLASEGFSNFLLRLILREAAAQPGFPGCTLNSKFEINCTLLADPLLGGVPTSFVTQPCPEWHTSGDRVGRITLDPEVLRFIAAVTATWAYFLATAGDAEAEWLLGHYAEAIRLELAGGEIADREIYFWLKRRELLTLAAIVSSHRRESFIADIDALLAASRRAAPHLAAGLPFPSSRGGRDTGTHHLYPKALVGGTAVDNDFSSAELEALGRPKWNLTHLVLKSWADGTLSIDEICRLAAYETGRPVAPDYGLAFFTAYAAHGLVELRPG